MRQTPEAQTPFAWETTPGAAEKGAVVRAEAKLLWESPKLAMFGIILRAFTSSVC